MKHAMLKEKTISEIILHYHIIPFLAYMVVLLILAPFLGGYICNKVEDLFNFADPIIITVFVYGFLLLIWAYPFFFVTRETVYRDITGRIAMTMPITGVRMESWSTIILMQTLTFLMWKIFHAKTGMTRAV